ncbi:hypothetical protein [Hymenobacter chitinivorans]|uniref:hypothetical protein n=1 Tax=Hymenobacter chitinivorans TaxID=89969 RepID=UPI0012FD0D67|nr:hypothetical protein [Hymenobacter chitinivorans]
MPAAVVLPEPPAPVIDDKVLAYIDSLEQAITQHRSLPALQKLDSVACISDGYVTEAVDKAAVTIWARQFTLTVRYLHQLPTSLLRHQLIWGLSADMFTADNRAQALTTFRATALDSARRAGLSSAEMVFLQKILGEVNPALLD